jgi:hypothetical protein
MKKGSPKVLVLRINVMTFSESKYWIQEKEMNNNKFWG